MGVLFGVVATVVAFAWLNHINPEFSINDDGIRDQLLARDCVELDSCSLIGAPTSVPGVHQGAVWLDLLIAVRLLGGDESTARKAVLVLLALSIGTLFTVVWRWLRPSLATPAAVLALAALSLDTYPSQLINPSASAFPDVLTAAGLLCYALSGRMGFIVIAALALGLAVNVHVGALCLVPSLLAVAVLGSRRPVAAILLAGVVLAATCLFTSRAALWANVDGLVSRGRLFPALAGLGAIVFLSARYGPAFRRLSRQVRAWTVGVILLSPFGAGVLWLLVWQRHAFGYTYLHPAVAPAATFAAALISIPFEFGRRWGARRWVPTAASLAAVGCVATAPRSPAHLDSASWTPADAAAIVESAGKKGWSYEALMFHVQSRNCLDLVVGMSTAAPPPTSPAPAKTGKELQVLRAPRARLAALPAALDLVPLANGAVAVVREVDSWMRPEALVACVVPEASAAPLCMPAQAGTVEAGDRFLFGTRAFPEIHRIDRPPPYLARDEIPLHPVAGESREIVALDDGVPGCGWMITRADGVRVDSPLPARRVRISSDTGAPGVLVFERALGTAVCPSDLLDKRYPPCAVETTPDDELRALAENQ